MEPAIRFNRDAGTIAIDVPMPTGLETSLLLIEEMLGFRFSRIQDDEHNRDMIAENNLIVCPDQKAYAIQIRNDSPDDDGYFIPLPSKAVGDQLIRIWKTIRKEVLANAKQFQ